MPDPALDAARHLIDHGVPVFIAEPDTDTDGNWQPHGGHGGTGYWLPHGWQRTTPDPDVLDQWQPGKALCAVTGHTIDLLDRDTHKGGNLNDTAKPTSYGSVATPSGGTHDWIAALGRRSKDGVLPGVDVKSGEPGGAGRGFAFLPPTVKLSKVDRTARPYKWTTPPDLSRLVLIGDDGTGDDLRQLLDRSGDEARLIASWDGDDYASLDADKRRWADEHVASMLRWWETHLDGVADWPEGQTDDRGRGWEALTRDCAWALALLACTPWTGLDEDRAAQEYERLLPDALAVDPKCRGKWTDALLAKAAMEPVDSPPWDTGFTPVAVDRQRNRPVVTLASPAEAFEWLRREAGRPGTQLAGLFRRGGSLVHTPRIGEEGYEPLTDGAGDDDGPAQVRDLDAHGLKARIQNRYRLIRQTRSGTTRIMFPFEAAVGLTAAADEVGDLRLLRRVTHTPAMRGDGTVLDRPGYDDATATLYIPPRGFSALPVPERPTQHEVAEARDLLALMLADFPFNTTHDRANYLALLLTPLIREMLPPPYKLVAINAHQRGSGKSLLAWIARTLHGGVMRGDVPSTGEEFRKQITGVLTSTTGAVVQFDNVTELRSSKLDALLTSSTWSDRVLGESRDATMANDRVWVATGNNIILGGDMPRRVLWVTIDPNDPRPEQRTNFRIPNLEGWVIDHRPELLAALLTLVRAWVVAGRPEGRGGRMGTDSYSAWTQACDGILTLTEIEGVVGHQETVRATESDEDAEWGALLAALHERFGAKPWKASDAAAVLEFDELPTGMKPGAKSLGRWLARREGRWSGGRAAVVDRWHGHNRVWRIKTREGEG